MKEIEREAQRDEQAMPMDAGVDRLVPAKSVVIQERVFLAAPAAGEPFLSLSRSGRLEPPTSLGSMTMLVLSLPVACCQLLSDL